MLGASSMPKDSKYIYNSKLIMSFYSRILNKIATSDTDARSPAQNTRMGHLSNPLYGVPNVT